MIRSCLSIKKYGFSIPVTAVGISFIKVPLTYKFASLRILLWLGIVVILAMIASYILTWNASRLVVREALANE